MKAWWANLLDALHGSLWFVPAIMGLASVIVAGLLLGVDVTLHHRDGDGLGWLHAGDADAVRNLLSAILTAVITVLTVVLSITIVALSLASSQFGPRMLRNFMQDRLTQVVMGTFIATVTYCLVLLAVLGRLEQSGMVPHVGVLGAMGLTAISVAALMFFVHHIARSIQSFEVVAAVARELDAAIDRMFPDPMRGEGEADSTGGHPPLPVEDAAAIASPQSDYIQTIDFPSLKRLAEQHDLTLQVVGRAGTFLMEGDDMVLAWPTSAVDDDVREAIVDAFILGNRRNPTQDVEFSMRQLVEIAVRALSPSINDPFTAMDCVDRLGSALARLAGRDMSDPYHLRENGEAVRVYVDGCTFEGVVRTAFDQIRQHSRSSVAVTIRLLDTLRHVSMHARTESQRQALRQQAQMVRRGAMEALPEEQDRHDAATRYRRLIDACP